MIAIVIPVVLLIIVAIVVVCAVLIYVSKVSSSVQLMTLKNNFQSIKSDKDFQLLCINAHCVKSISWICG